MAYAKAASESLKNHLEHVIKNHTMEWLSRAQLLTLKAQRV